MNPDLTAQILAYAAAVGLLWPTVQALLQKRRWPAKVKSIITVVAAVIFGAAGYIVSAGLNFDTSNPSSLVTWVLGLYAAILLGYQALKRPVLDKLEEYGNGSAEATNTDESLDDEVHEEGLPENPYGDRVNVGNDDEVIHG